jgi:hypothetical protein
VSSKFTAATFAFLHQVNANDKLLASDLKVALALTTFFNEKDGGRAFPGYETLGTEAGVSETTVIRAVRRMEQHGHLRVVWGQPGRGHPNQYWMVVKPAPVKVLDGRKPSSEAAGKPSSVSRKPSPVKENLLKNQEGLLQRPSIGEREDRVRDLPRDRGGAPAGAARSTEARDAFQALCAIWRRGHAKDDLRETIAAAWRAFQDAIARGATPAQILDAARLHVAAADKPRFLPALDTWLITRGYEKPPPQQGNKQRRGGRASKSAARAMAALVISED